MQAVLRNLMISVVVFRTEEDADVAPHVFAKQVEVMAVSPSPEVQICREGLLQSLRGVVVKLQGARVYWGNPDPEACARFSFLDASNKARTSGQAVPPSAWAWFKLVRVRV